MTLLRKKSGLITREKPDYRDYLRDELSESDFSCHLIELQFSKGFPDIIALRKCSWFIEVKWLRDVTSSDDPGLCSKLIKEATILQKKWLGKESTLSYELDGKQVYALVGGYYEGEVVKHSMAHFIKGEEKYVFVPDFTDWEALDEMCYYS